MIQRRTPILLSQQRFDFSGGIALALAFFYQHSEELIKNPKPIIYGLVAKPSKRLFLFSKTISD